MLSRHYIGCKKITSDAIYSEDFTSAQLPADYVSQCIGTVSVLFGVYYEEDGTPFKGIKGGITLIGSTSVRFSYDW